LLDGWTDDLVFYVEFYILFLDIAILNYNFLDLYYIYFYKKNIVDLQIISQP
jgi:hypothetical protein